MYTHQIKRLYPDPDPNQRDKLDLHKHPHQSYKLDPDQFGYDKPKCMENETI
jgi:hypothetical protein